MELEMTLLPISQLSIFLTNYLLLLSSLSLHRSLGDGDVITEKTLAIIKPDGLLGNYTKLIKDRILENGFIIHAEKVVQLDVDTVMSFYSEHSLQSFFPGLVKYMTSGPVLIMVLEKDNAVVDWRVLIGPTDGSKAKATHPQSIRAICGLDLQRNCVHGSDSLKSAAREISILFKDTSSGTRSVHDEL